jgi:hypothetical protein
MVRWEDFRKHIIEFHGVKHPKVTEDNEDGTCANFVASYAIEVPNHMLSDEYFYQPKTLEGEPIAPISTISPEIPK